MLGTTALLGAVSPGLVSLAGLVAVWRHAGPDDRVAAHRLAGLMVGASPATVPTRRRLFAAVLRFVAGAALIAICTSTLIKPKHLNETDLTVALAALGVIAGFALILAPWWLRLGRELSGERRERARAEERAEMAEHLHDSVLQTLALIQRSASDPQQVQRLARAQERQLRSWLFDGAPRGPMGLQDPGTVSEGAGQPAARRRRCPRGAGGGGDRGRRRTGRTVAGSGGCGPGGGGELGQMVGSRPRF